MQIIQHRIPFYARPAFSIKSFAQQSNRFLISFVVYFVYLEPFDLSDAHFDGILRNARSPRGSLDCISIRLSAAREIFIAFDGCVRASHHKIMRLCPISQIVLLNVRGRTLFWVIIFNPFFALSSSAAEEAGAFEKPISKDDLDGAQNNYFMFNLVTILMMRNFQLIPICSESLLLRALRY
jgi:hypothetical protein